MKKYLFLLAFIILLPSVKAQNIDSTTVAKMQEATKTLPRYKMYKTTNSFIMLKLNTRTGKVWMTQRRSKNTPSIEVPINGVTVKHTFLSNGKHLQSYNINEKSMSAYHSVRVIVNGEEWKKVEALYEMGPKGKGFMCKTSINIGLTVSFGNGDFGKIPESGSIIEVSYISPMESALEYEWNSWNGRYDMYPTNNIWTFIIVDTYTGKTYQLQWYTELDRCFVEPIEN